MKNTYKSYIHIWAAAFLFTLFFISCGGDDNNADIPVTPADETSGLTKVQEFSNDAYTFSLYTKTGTFITGYNEIYLQVKNKTTGEYEKNTTFSWNPVMHMMSMTHSCPYSSITKADGKQTLYKGFIIFPMAGSQSEYWELILNSTLNGQTSQTTANITVTEAAKTRVQTFTGTDNIRYVLAMADPAPPAVGSNTLTAYLYKIQDMNTYVPVNGYTVKIDPRMPSMGHGSPNNIDMAYTGSSGFYQGKVNFTMTGLWRINMILLNQDGQIVKGEAVTDTQSTSSLYFEIEF